VGTKVARAYGLHPVRQSSWFDIIFVAVSMYSAMLLTTPDSTHVTSQITVFTLANRIRRCGRLCGWSLLASFTIPTGLGLRGPARCDLDVIHITTGMFCCILSTVRELEELYKTSLLARGTEFGEHIYKGGQQRVQCAGGTHRCSMRVKIPLYREHC
jgi:hypothetical protein